MAFHDLITQAKSVGGIFEIIRFVFIGGLATLTDLCVTVVLLYATQFHEVVITTLAFCVAFFVSFFGHAKVTFKRSGNIFKFLALSVSMLLLRNLIVFLLVTYVMRGLIPIVFAMAVVTVITFVLSKKFVFNGAPS